MDQLRVPIPDETGLLVQTRFEEFLRSFHREHENEELTQQRFLDDYMLQIENMISCNKSTVYVSFVHLREADMELAEAIELEYARFEPYLRHAVHNIVAQDNQQYVYDVDKGQREFFVAFYNLSSVEKIRMVRTGKIGRLMSISGTVTRTSEVRPELFYGHFICKKCATIHPHVEQQYQYTEPPVCRNPQCANTGQFQLVMDKSAFIDWQRVRVQENADEIPAGSMPRCIDVICRNEVVEIAKAGDKIVISGAVTVLPDTTGLARAGESAVSSKSSMANQFNDGVQGLKKLGVKEMTYKLIFVASSVMLTDQRTGHINAQHILPYYDLHNLNQGHPQQHDATEDSTATFSEAELKDIGKMYKTPQLYNQMAESICPSVFGHMEVKRGILLMLLGGLHKKTPEGISLRGDLNVCIVGDPSCAKSQFLKYVHGFLPRTVYTSGKSSSAAGLTASVVRDAETGEFCVEAGALMLADNGICCIDEFDKMEATDQVAIHEAMEQQTISITKAGIQATLNARTSILAAANPVYGRYDRSKTLKANIAVSAAIMSRFDLFFVILDECNPKMDRNIAKHIVNVHKANGLNTMAQAAPFAREQLQKYISFARTLSPKFTTQSRNVLVECYRLLRSNDLLGKNKTAYRITVRQLESLVRLSEALARLHLDDEIKEVYVREAYRLLQRSIIFVETEDIELDEEEIGDRPAYYGGGGEDAEDHESYMAAMMDEEAHDDAAAAHLDDAEAAQAAAMDSHDQPPPTTTSASTSIPAPAAGKEKKAKKASTHITAKEYDEMTHLLSMHIRQLEDNQSEEDFAGIVWKDLVQWYVQHVQPPASSSSAEEASASAEVDVEKRTKLVNQVIRRMVKHEGNLIVVTEDEQLPNEEKVLKLHPSFTF